MRSTRARMDTTLDQFDAARDATAPTKCPRAAALPFELRVLYITTDDQSGDWMAEALSADRATRVTLEEAIGATEGMRRLRDELFDAVLICHVRGKLRRPRAARWRQRSQRRPADHRARQRADRTNEPALLRSRGRRILCIHRPPRRGSSSGRSPARVQHATLVQENRRLLALEAQRLEQSYNEAKRLLEEQKAILNANDSERATSSHCYPTNC